ISLIRKRIRNPNLWVESFTIGKVSQTDIRIMYINGIANEEIVEEVRQRLNKIDIDQILDASFLQQFIQDKVFTSFPTIYYTERPDVVTANLMEGRVAIFVDGSRSEEHTSELQSRENLVCRLLLDKKNMSCSS